MIIKYSIIIFITLITIIHAESVHYSVTPQKTSLGNKVRYMIKVVYSKNTKLLSIPPKTLFNAAPYEHKLIDYNFKKTLNGSLYTLKLYYDIAIFEQGKHQIPAHEIIISKKNKRKIHKLTPPPITITPDLNRQKNQLSHNQIAKPPTLNYLSTRISPNYITIGDAFRYSISFQYPITSTLVDVPPKTLFNNTDYDIELTNYTVNKKKSSTAYDIHLNYDLKLFGTGQFIIPTHNIVLKNKTQYKTYTIANQLITIHSVVTENQTNQFKDIKPLLLTAFPTLSLLKLSLITIIAITMCLALFLYIRKKRQSKWVTSPAKIQEPIDDRPINTRYIERFNQLKESDFYHNNDHDSFYIELVDILRDYLSERYEKNIFEFTTTEILMHFSSILPEKPMSKLKLVLNSSQLIKFARITPNQDFHNSIIDTCIDIINQTTI